MSLDLTHAEARGHLKALALGLGAEIPVLWGVTREEAEGQGHLHGYALAHVAFDRNRRRGTRAGLQRFEGVGSLTLMVMVPDGLGTAKLDRLYEAFESACQTPQGIPLYFRDLRRHEVGRLEEILKTRIDLTAVFVRHYRR